MDDEMPRTPGELALHGRTDTGYSTDRNRPQGAALPDRPDPVQDIRFARIGTQLLLATLMALAFTNRFMDTTRFQRIVFVVAMVLVVASNALLLAPARPALVASTRRFALWGVALLMLAMNAAVLLILDFVIGTHDAMMITSGTLLWFVGWLYLAPVWVRLRRRRAATDARSARSARRTGVRVDAERVPEPLTGLAAALLNPPPGLPTSGARRPTLYGTPSRPGIVPDLARARARVPDHAEQSDRTGVERTTYGQAAPREPDHYTMPGPAPERRAPQPDEEPAVPGWSTERPPVTDRPPAPAEPSTPDGPPRAGERPAEHGLPTPRPPELRPGPTWPAPRMPMMPTSYPVYPAAALGSTPDEDDDAPSTVQFAPPPTVPPPPTAPRPPDAAHRPPSAPVRPTPPSPRNPPTRPASPNPKNPIPKRPAAEGSAR